MRDLEKKRATNKASEERCRARDPEAWAIKRRASAARRRAKNPERPREHTRRYREKYPEKITAYSARHNKTEAHKMSVGKHCAKKASEQEKVAGRPRPATCEICGGANPSGKRMHFDHRHATGLFRGWLCSGCNLALGLVRDSPTLLRKLASYVENPPGVSHAS